MTPPNSAVPLPEERLQAALGRGGRLGTPPTELPLRVVVELLEGESLIVRVLSGRLKAGQVLAFSPTHKSGRLQRLEDAAGDVVEEVAAGAVARITLREKFAMEPGHIGAELVQAPIESNRFKAAIEWRGRAALALGEAVCLRLGRQEVRAELVAIERSVNAQGETVLSPTAVAGGSVAEVTWQSRGALVFDNDAVNPHLSRFTLATGEGEPSGCGLLHSGHYLDRARVKSENIFWSEGNITARDRAMRNGHKGAVVWLTGLSGSGKSTISRALERELFQRGLHVYVLDGDNVRHGLNSNLGFSPEDRVENIRRVAEVAKLLSGAGTIAVTAFISPYRDDRRRAREIALEAGGDFIEVFVDAPLAVCEQRDAKGLYKRARAGEIKEFTGISAPYEAPTDPEVSVRTDQLDRDACVARIIAFLLPRLTVETE